jgi:hypothetical protein
MLCAHIDYIELAKFPKLITHYLEHKEINADFGIFDFISMHYIQRLVLDSDYEKDAELPFKAQHSCLFSDCPHIYVDISEKIQAVLQEENYSPAQYQSYYTDTYSFTPFTAIWQPPCQG